MAITLTAEVETALATLKDGLKEIYRAASEKAHPLRFAGPPRRKVSDGVKHAHAAAHKQSRRLVAP